MFITLAMTGCAQQRSAGELLMDRGVSLSRRVDAVSRLDASARRADLLKIVWDDAEPTELRLVALDAVAAADPAALSVLAGERLDAMQQPRVVSAVCSHIARPFNHAALAGLIKRWALPWSTPDDNAPRPEPAAVAAITGQPDPLIVVQDILAGHWPTDVRIAAWTVLVNEQPAETVRHWLQSSSPLPGPGPGPGGDTLLPDLRAAAELLDELPAGRLAVLWLLLKRADAPGWQAAERAVQDLTDTERRGLALRHLPALSKLGPPRARQLISVASTRLQPHDAVIRDGEITALDPLPWPDRLLAATVFDAAADPAFAQALFEQADADRLDITSEHGGIITWQDHALSPVSMPPAAGSHDRAYAAPPQWLLKAFDGLTTYHFHAERTKNADHAGPAQGDRQLAARTGLSLTILTTLDRDTLNLDILFPDGTCIDLGLVRRPR